MKASEDVDEAEESLKNWKEGIRVVRLRPTDENICEWYFFIVHDLNGRIHVTLSMHIYFIYFWSVLCCC